MKSREMGALPQGSRSNDPDFILLTEEKAAPPIHAADLVECNRRGEGENLTIYSLINEVLAIYVMDIPISQSNSSGNQIIYFQPLRNRQK
jgi:hypothetical protein